MELKTDVILKGPIWAKTIDQTVGKTGKIFKTNWDLYALGITIGMMHDCQIESDDMVPAGYNEEPRYIPRNVLNDVRRRTLLEFMLQAAMITTKHLDLEEDERLKIAFSDDQKLEFNPVVFLTKYANYGVKMIHDIIDDTDNVETMVALMEFLNKTYDDGIIGYDVDEDLDDD